MLILLLLRFPFAFVHGQHTQRVFDRIFRTGRFRLMPADVSGKRLMEPHLPLDAAITRRAFNHSRQH
jgi:hypothetical protein